MELSKGELTDFHSNWTCNVYTLTHTSTRPSFSWQFFNRPLIWRKESAKPFNSSQHTANHPVHLNQGSNSLVHFIFPIPPLLHPLFLPLNMPNMPMVQLTLGKGTSILLAFRKSIDFMRDCFNTKFVRLFK